MQTPKPHFVLFSEASGAAGARQWRFILQCVGGETCLSADDTEPGARASRLELLAVVRGLEALDRPSRVTLLTKSRYVTRGISRGLAAWRERNWRWDRFGRVVPIRDVDLWQRVDRALEFHHVECCGWNVDEFPSAAAAHLATCRPAEATLSLEAALPSANEPALLIVPRTATRRLASRGQVCWPWADALERLRRGVFARLALIWRPAFTRAA